MPCHNRVLTVRVAACLVVFIVAVRVASYPHGDAAMSASRDVAHGAIVTVPLVARTVSEPLRKKRTL